MFVENSYERWCRKAEFFGKHVYFYVCDSKGNEKEVRADVVATEPSGKLHFDNFVCPCMAGALGKPCGHIKIAKEWGESYGK